jgi:hypothetical protein
MKTGWRFQDLQPVFPWEQASLRAHPHEAQLDSIAELTLPGKVLVA